MNVGRCKKCIFKPSFSISGLQLTYPFLKFICYCSCVLLHDYPNVIVSCRNSILKLEELVIQVPLLGHISSSDGLAYLGSFVVQQHVCSFLSEDLAYSRAYHSDEM